MSELDELRARVDALESALRGVDLDQSDNGAAIRATHHLVQALSITQAQHTAWLEELRTGQRAIVGLLTTLIERDGGE
jgi:hypothetical protein